MQVTVGESSFIVSCCKLCINDVGAIARSTSTIYGFSLLLFVVPPGLCFCAFVDGGRLCVIDVDFLAWSFPAPGSGIHNRFFV